MEITLECILTIYSFSLIFLIFCFQEINNKIRHAQDKFRSWCLQQKEESRLDLLGIDRHIEAWLEKDLIN